MYHPKHLQNVEKTPEMFLQRNLVQVPTFKDKNQ
jgi:hypothetical protein